MNENIILALEKIAIIYRILLLEIGKENNLSATQIEIIDSISKNKANTITLLAKEFNIKKSTISDSVNNLLKKGYIQKTISEKDNRSYNLILTEKSNSILNKFRDRLKNLFSIINNFSEQEKNIVLKFFSEVIKDLYNKKFIQKARLCLTCSNLKRLENTNEKPFYCNFTNLKFDYNNINFNCNYYQEN